jgi:hypothetical protein
MVMQHCNLSYLEGRGRKIMVQGWPKQKHKALYEKQTKRKKKRLRIYFK